MCCATKTKISSTLMELLRERPLRKITVQDIMERTGMKRQSFYYHFQAVEQVLRWSVHTHLRQTLRYVEDERYEDWCLRALEELKEQDLLYRAACDALGRSAVLEELGEISRPQLCALMLDEAYPDWEALSEQQRFAVGFFDRALNNALLDSLICEEAEEQERNGLYARTLSRFLPARSAMRYMPSVQVS